MDAEPAVEILIIGSGASSLKLAAGHPAATCCRTKGIGIETMDTGAACRTYNVLAGEGRRVGAALIAL